jgi:hypothetical protein
VAVTGSIESALMAVLIGSANARRGQIVGMSGGGLDVVGIRAPLNPTRAQGRTVNSSGGVIPDSLAGIR